MRRALPVICCTAALGGLLLLWPAAAIPQAKDKLPKVEPHTHKAYGEKLAEDVEFEMLPIPGGTYMIGNPNPKADESEKPQRPVAVKPFWMGKCEVAWDEFDLYWENRPAGPPPRPEIGPKPAKLPDAITSPTPPYDDQTFGYGRKGYPVIAVSYHAAMEYCRWLSKKTGKAYRLPTEAEWEWAARAGSANDAIPDVDDFWNAKNSKESPQPVGKKKANAWGLHDIRGNVSEWCIDEYKKDFYSTLPADKLSLNPFSPPTENRYPYTVRGGSWNDEPEKCTLTIRRGSSKTWLKRDPQRPQSIWWMTDAEWVGFRIVRAVEEDERLKDVRSKVSWWSQ
ncbi:MAG: formylglycine-generating enzyme family protein [Gemmataceae bacterium]|nr:formylglycine-generating enzyme family protein [Gemmataceae bacterium]